MWRPEKVPLQVPKKIPKGFQRHAIIDLANFRFWTVRFYLLSVLEMCQLNCCKPEFVLLPGRIGPIGPQMCQCIPLAGCVAWSLWMRGALLHVSSVQF